MFYVDADDVEFHKRNLLFSGESRSYIQPMKTPFIVINKMVVV